MVARVFLAPEAKMGKKLVDGLHASAGCVAGLLLAGLALGALASLLCLLPCAHGGVSQEELRRLFGFSAFGLPRTTQPRHNGHMTHDIERTGRQFARLHY